MARSVNRQVRSVGNLGDILKHAALIELASKLRERCGSVRYIETHTFLLHAPASDLTRWTREIETLVAEREAYARYAAIERAHLARTGRYRCSSGLVIDQLGEHRSSTWLGEAHAETRDELRAQVEEEQLSLVTIVKDAEDALREAVIPEGSALLVHIDPFSLSPELWARLAPALDASCARAGETAVVVYRYTRSAPSAWPIAPNGTLGPVAKTRGGPHELAVYTSIGIADSVREICFNLGWQLEPRRA